MNVRVGCVLAMGVLVVAAGCGKKGNPLPPLRPLPGRVMDLTAVRTGDEVRLDLTIPAANADGTTPAVLDRIDIYAVDTQAPPPTASVPAAGTPGAPAVPAPADGTSSAAATPPASVEGTPAATAPAPTSAEGTSPAAPPAPAPSEGTPAATAPAPTPTEGTSPPATPTAPASAEGTSPAAPTAPAPTAPAPAEGTPPATPAATASAEEPPPAAAAAPASAEGTSPAAPAASVPVAGTSSVAPGASGQKAGTKRAAPIAPIPTPAQIIANPKNLRGTISIRHPDPDATSSSDQKDSSKNGKTAKNGKKDQQPKASRPPAPDDHRPVPGDHAFIIDHLAPSAAGDGTVRRYVAVAVAGKGKGRPGAVSAIVSMPFAGSAAVPEHVTLTYDETTITLAWDAGTEKAFRVFGTGPVFDDAKAELLTPASLTAPKFTVPVKFGEERCFIVRAVQVTGSTTIESDPSPVACVTPADTYPPAAPAGLQAIQEGTAVTLIWSAVDAPDLAGYILLRSDGAGETFHPLVKQPMPDTTYKDADVTVGMTYLYAVIALDKAGNPSEQSNRQSVTIR